MSKHAESQRQVESLRIGHRINVRSGVGMVTIIDIGPIQPASEGWYAGARVLHTTGDAFMPFAEHLLYYMDDGIGAAKGWFMVNGTSYQNLPQAVKAFWGQA